MRKGMNFALTNAYFELRITHVRVFESLGFPARKNLDPARVIDFSIRTWIFDSAQRFLDMEFQTRCWPLVDYGQSREEGVPGIRISVASISGGTWLR